MDSQLTALASEKNGTFSSAQAIARSVHPDDLREAVRAGELIRVRRGAYVTAEVWAPADGDEQFRLTAMAVGQTRPGDTLSHHAALAMYRLPLWGHDPKRVDLEADVGQSVKRGAVCLHPRGVSRQTARETPAVPLRVLPGPESIGEHLEGDVLAEDSEPTAEMLAAYGLPDQDRSDLLRVAEVDGMPVVSIARAIVRTALTMGRDCAVVAGDAALHRGLVGHDDLMAEVALVSPHEGRRRALVAVACMDAKAESVGESRTRLIVQDHGLEWDSQVRIPDESGRVVARVDLLVEGLVVEFDGRVKYRLDGAQDPEAAARILWAEKRREDAIRRRGHPVERVVWSDLDRPRVLAARIRGAIPLAGSGHLESSAG